MIGIGIIGAGHFGGVHATAIAGVEGARIVAACSGDPDGAAAFVGRHGGTAHRDWRALLADPAVDAVVLATPHHLHEEIAIAALEAGRHVLLEKPMAPTLTACDAINAAAARSSALLMVGHLPHFMRPLLAARDIVDSGRLGRPVTGTSTLVKLWMQANRRPWHLERSTGGGMLMTAGIHAIDQLIWLLGGRVASVSAFAGAYFHEQSADDLAFLGLRLGDGRVGQVTSIGYRDGATTTGMQLICEGGVIDVDLNAGVRIGQGGAWTAVPDSFESDGMGQAVRREWAAFLAAIAAGGTAPIDGQYGRHIVAVIDAALRSAETQREIAVG